MFFLFRDGTWIFNSKGGLNSRNAPDYLRALFVCSRYPNVSYIITSHQNNGNRIPVRREDCPHHLGRLGPLLGVSDLSLRREHDHLPACPSDGEDTGRLDHTAGLHKKCTVTVYIYTYFRSILVKLWVF